MLDWRTDGEAVTPTDAATLVLIRAGAGGGIEVFCVERNKQSRFMGGAVVFPGGKLDSSDGLDAWIPLAAAPRRPAPQQPAPQQPSPQQPSPQPPSRGTAPFADSEGHFRSLLIACARETLEEAAILLVCDGTVEQEALFTLRKELETAPDALRAFLSERRLRLDLTAIYPLARWITPEAESRRFDARFFVAVAPEGHTGAHDERETMSSFWASPAEVLRRFEAGEVQLMPPTHRTIALLADCASTAAVLTMAESSNLDPICPRLVPQKEAQGETIALVLPGDPEHEVRDARVPGRSRYVLRDGRWRPEDPPR